MANKSDIEKRNVAPPILIRAASVVVIRFDQVLMVKRSKPPAQNLWSFPGGRMEPGETPDQTAVREALEETGFTVTLIGSLGINTANIPATRHAPARHFEINVFTGTVGDGEPIAGDDAELAKFIKCVDVPNLATTEGAAAWVTKALKHHT